MNRAKKFKLNALFAVVKQLIALACGFILPVYILQSYGSAVNGLVSSITQFLAFITLLEMGVGPVIQSNLYKPLADKDTEAISKIFVASTKFFRRIAYIFLIYIAALVLLYPLFVSDSFDRIFSGSLILIISISTFAQYFFGISLNLLLNADQRAYIAFALQAGTLALNTLVSVLLMQAGFGIHFVQISTAIIFLMRPLGMLLYVRRHYQIDKDIEYEGEPIKQKWNGLSQHLASVVTNNTDVTLLTIFSSLENVSIYAVHALVVNGMTNTALTAVTGLEAMWGNMLAKGEMEILRKSFERVEWFVHAGITLAFTLTAILIVPFVTVYTRSIHDADYFAPTFAIIFVAAYACLCLRVPYFRLIKAAGHYKQTQNGAWIQMILNLGLSLALVVPFGLIGVAIGTLVAMIYHTIYFAWYLRENILQRDFKFFLRHTMTDILTAILIFLVAKKFLLEEISWQGWIILALKCSGVAILISAGVNLLFNRKFILNQSRRNKSRV